MPMQQNKLFQCEDCQCRLQLSEWPDGKFGYIATELCDYTLKAWLLDQAEADLVAVGLVRDLLEGLYHLHGEEVLHRDLKVCWLC